MSKKKRSDTTKAYNYDVIITSHYYVTSHMSRVYSKKYDSKYEIKYFVLFFE